VGIEEGAGKEKARRWGKKVQGSGKEVGKREKPFENSPYEPNFEGGRGGGGKGGDKMLGICFCQDQKS